MSVLIKICGLKSFEALDVALEAGADLVGFVFFSPSPRHVGADTARALCERVRGRAQKVALSVDASDDELAASIDALTPDLLQLHGRETPERVAAVRARFGLPVMKALPIAEHADLAAIRLYEDAMSAPGEIPPDITWEAHAGVASVYGNAGDKTRARTHFESALHAIEHARAGLSQNQLIPQTSRRRCASPPPRPSTSPPASSARLGRRIPRRSARSSRRRATPDASRPCPTGS